ncbi:AI-2E family transporter [Natranaerobius trueperi]|uniref:AI-2E family transporter n=1 Tax=Natranaerobius trueperi TaxID=759412 RepID=A0A226BWM3_9FIRM|nr:AI-2E family transporter [Natranaerobius trueperi]OWZ83438.1 hypothetical protein CDO51_08590 [Natranaerobius trueperi]
MDTGDRRLFRNAAVVTIAIVVIVGLFYFIMNFLGTVITLRSQIFNFLLPFFIAFILAYIFKPTIDLLEENKVPRSLAILILFAVIGGFLVFWGTRAFSTIIKETQKLIAVAPDYAEEIQSFIKQIEIWIDRHELPITVTEVIRDNIEEVQRDLTLYLDRIVDVESLFGVALGFFGHFLSLVAFPIILFYFLKDADLIKKNLSFVIPNKYRKRVLLVLRDINRTIGAYIRSQIIICGFIGVLTYLGLWILGVDFAMVLGLIAGITNIIPYFGPFLGAIPSTVVGFVQAPTLAITVIILITVIQQVESQILAPQIYGRNLAIHPLAVVTVLIAGGHFFGVIGMILAVPILAIIRVIIRHLALGFWLADK